MNRHNIWNGKVITGNAVISIFETTATDGAEDGKFHSDFDLRLAGYMKGEGKS